MKVFPLLFHFYFYVILPSSLSQNLCNKVLEHKYAIPEEGRDKAKPERGVIRLMLLLLHAQDQHIYRVHRRTKCQL
jgi:hypothetical protein